MDRTTEESNLYINEEKLINKSDNDFSQSKILS